jgi:hypothetical protein
MFVARNRKARNLALVAGILIACGQVGGCAPAPPMDDVGTGQPAPPCVAPECRMSAQPVGCFTYIDGEPRNIDCDELNRRNIKAYAADTEARDGKTVTVTISGRRVVCTSYGLYLTCP